MEMIINVGVQSFKVRLEDDGIPILKSKIVQGSTQQTTSQKTPTGDSSSQAMDPQGTLVCPPPPSALIHP